MNKSQLQNLLGSPLSEIKAAGRHQIFNAILLGVLMGFGIFYFYDQACGKSIQQDRLAR